MVWCRAIMAAVDKGGFVIVLLRHRPRATEQAGSVRKQEFMCVISRVKIIFEWPILLKLNSV